MTPQRPARFKIKPHAYLEAIERRAKQIDGVHRVRATAYHYERADLRVTYSGDAASPAPEVMEAIDVLRREFSSAFPSWGISVTWSWQQPLRIQQVERSYILGNHVYQDLACGHRVRGGRLRSKRRCPCCTEALEVSP